MNNMKKLYYNIIIRETLNNYKNIKNSSGEE